MGSKTAILCLCLGVLGIFASAARAEVFVTWEESPPPVAPDDYEITGNDVELKTGSMTWRIWLEGANNLGTITCPYPANFGVKFEDDTGGPGATRVTDINLIPSDPGNYSNITGGRITNLIFGLEVQQSQPAGVGGEVDNFTIGDINGDIDIPVLRSLTCTGGLKTGDVTVSDKIDGEGFEVTGNWFGGTFSIADIVSGEVLFSNANLDFFGTLDLLNGVPSGGTVTMHLEMVPGSVINLNGKGVAGVLQFQHSSRGNIINGGAITGQVRLASGTGNAFFGTATFASISNPGYVRVVDSADLEGTIAVTGITSGVAFPIRVSGDVNGGTITLGALQNARITLQGSVTSQGQVTITDQIGGGSEVYIEQDLGGTLTLTTGIEAGNTMKIGGPLLASGQIDLNNADVAGTLLIESEGRGRINSGGAVTGTVTLANGTGNAFSGTATFADVSATGTVQTISSADLSGRCETTGSMAGSISISGDLVFGGKIWVAGDASGDVSVDSDALGDVQIDGNLTSSESITVGGALAKAGVGSGRIMVGGECGGPIRVGEDTQSLSLIQLVGGLATGGSIEINTTNGIFDANGLIHVGPADLTIPDITFDGCIHIYDDGAGSGGALNNALTVQGCHATADDLDICIDGPDNGNVTILQSGCTNQVGWSCPDPACP